MSPAFWINVPVALAALLLGLRLVPESRDPNPGVLDTVGVLLFVAGLVFFVWVMMPLAFGLVIGSGASHKITLKLDSPGRYPLP